MRIDSPISSNAQITGSFNGSFSGSFVGDGSLLGGVTAEWDGTHDGNASITGSLNVSSDIIVGGTVDGVDVAQLSSDYSLTSASAASNAAAISNLDNTYATDAALSSLSSSAASALRSEYEAGDSALSSSAHSQRVAIESGLSSDISTLSGSAHSQRVAIESGLSSDISGLSGSAHTQRVALDSAQSSALTSVSGAFASTISTLDTGTSNLDSRVTALEGTDIAITLTGDVTGTGTITDLGDVSFVTTVADDSHNHIIANVDGLQGALDLKAPLASPALTGNPTAPTQAGTDDSTKIATTAFVQGRVDAIIGTAGAALDTLGELSASLSNDQDALAALTTTVAGKLAKASNLSDLTDAAAARTNLGVDTKANTWTGISGDISINSSGVATVADDSHNHTIANIDGLQAALDSKQAGGTYNTIIGTDTDISYTGATVLSAMNMTDGVIQSHSSRTLTLADLGYTGATNANYITNNNQLSNGAGYITSAGSISGNAATATKLATARTIAGVSFDGTANISLNNANITNGAGYTTYSANQTLNNNSNVHFEGLMVGQTSGATANTIRCVGDVVAYYSSDSQFKDNVETLEGALDKVKAIRGVRFDWNDKQDVYEGHDIGVIAQEVEAVLPELVHHRDYNDSKAVDYPKLTAVLIEAVKELSAKVEALENK